MEIPQQMIWSLSCQTDVQIIKKFLPNTSDYTKFKAMLFHVMQDLAKRLQKMGKAQPN